MPPRPPEFDDPGRHARQQLGAWGEAVAARFLERQGMRILERNLRHRLGELDLVAQAGDTLVFVEVKVRRRSDFGSPALAVDWRKQKRISRLALTYVNGAERGIRFDIIAITAPPGQRARLVHYPNAFEGVEP